MTTLSNGQATKLFRIQDGKAIDIIRQIKKALAGQDQVIALGIISCINNGTSPLTIIKEIKEMATEKYEVMAEMLGRGLLVDIINFK